MWCKFDIQKSIYFKVKTKFCNYEKDYLFKFDFFCTDSLCTANWEEAGKFKNADDGVEYNMNQEPFVGPAAIQRRSTQNQKENPKEVVNWTTDRVEIAASGDLAVEYGSYTDSGSGLSGTETDQGKYVTVYRKVNGTWKVAADIGNSTKLKDTSKW